MTPGGYTPALSGGSGAGPISHYSSGPWQRDGFFLSWWHDRWWLGRSGWLVVMVGGLTHGWLVVIGNGSWYTVWSVRERPVRALIIRQRPVGISRRVSIPWGLWGVRHPPPSSSACSVRSSRRVRRRRATTGASPHCVHFLVTLIYITCVCVTVTTLCHTLLQQLITSCFCERVICVQVFRLEFLRVSLQPFYRGSSPLVIFVRAHSRVICWQRFTTGRLSSVRFGGVPRFVNTAYRFLSPPTRPQSFSRQAERSDRKE